MLHRLTLRALALRVSAVRRVEDEAKARDERSADVHLEECAASHPAALGVRAMDVVRETAGLRCGECRRIYELDVTMFETHQR
jgi:hypothetical protein